MTPLVSLVDLFCGAGGTIEGALQAAAERGVVLDVDAVNHDETAIATGSKNHPSVRHHQKSLQGSNPYMYGLARKVSILGASPECTHHSPAAGARALSDQSRALPMCIPHWIEGTMPDVVLVENVPAFAQWGPLDLEGRPIKSKKGKLFLAWVNLIKELGYNVTWAEHCAADHGEAQERRRLFVMAVRIDSGLRVEWPAPTHAKNPTPGDMYRDCLKKWRSAREIIDWSLTGTSVFARKRPLAEKTMRRILRGYVKFSGGPALVKLYGTSNTADLSGAMPTVTANGCHLAVMEPYFVTMKGKSDARSADAPLATQTGGIHHYYAEPVLVNTAHAGGDRARSIDDSLATVTGGHRGEWALCKFVLGQQSCSEPRDVETATLPTVATAGAISLVSAGLVVPIDNGTGESGARSVEAPLSTIIAHDQRHGLAQPYLVTPCHGNKQGEDGDGRRTKSIDDPVGTVPCSNRFGVVQPFIVKYYGQGDGSSVDAPCPTATCKDRFGLAEASCPATPEGALPILALEIAGDTYAAVEINGVRYPLVHLGDGIVAPLDILFRMLQPHELAAAQGFPPGYHFTGNREQQVKQIGNAVPVNLSKALYGAIFEAMGYPKIEAERRAA